MNGMAINRAKSKADSKENCKANTDGKLIEGFISVRKSKSLEDIENKDSIN
jgi:hypothetical protein